MANKRQFKKNVDALAASMIDEMLVIYYNVEGVDRDAIGEAVGKVLGAVGLAKNHSNIYFDKGVKAFESQKEYSKAKRGFFRQLFKKIVADYSAEIDEALKQFNGAIPEEVRKQNKEIASN